jgi:hypothetical protein
VRISPASMAKGSAVNHLRHEFAHAWDNVRSGKNPQSLRKIKSRTRKPTRSTRGPRSPRLSALIPRPRCRPRCARCRIWSATTRRSSRSTERSSPSRTIRLRQNMRRPMCVSSMPRGIASFTA